MTFPVHTSPLAEVIRNFDWPSTSLGPIETWSPTLRTIVNLILESEFPKALVWGPDLVTIHNDAFLPILGDKPSAIGRSFAQVWSEAWESIGPIANKAFAGQSTYIEDYGLTVDRGAGPEQAYFTFCYSPVRDENGTIVGMMDTVVETTNTVFARATEAVLRRELIHRVKNMLAVTGAVVNSTLRHAATLDDAKDAISQRLTALASAQDISVGDLDAIDLEILIRRVMDPHVADWQRILLKGPAVNVQSRQALALSLVLYELATNAAKHGAMSTPYGHIALDWSVDESGQFSFSWTEQSEKTVSQPTRKGFGSQLMTRIGPAYFSGTGAADYEPSGLCYRLAGMLDLSTGGE